MNKDNELLKVSYEIRHQVPPAGWVRPKNGSYSISLEEHLITAEGVYDYKTGVLWMIGCRELEGSTDCQTLITVQFASLDARVLEHGKGVMSSLREKTDGLYFNKIDFNLYGKYTEDISESISRMDMESVMLAVSTTLPCVFTVLQILHAKRNPEAPAATSITMLVVLALGYATPVLISSSETVHEQEDAVGAVRELRAHADRFAAAAATPPAGLVRPPEVVGHRPEQGR
jgi:hypothetical protein